jgi:hypothetical protein
MRIQTVVMTMSTSPLAIFIDFSIVISLAVIPSRAFSAALRAGRASSRASLQSAAIASDASADFLATAASAETLSSMT